jgi:hypothetical protein
MIMKIPGWKNVIVRTLVSKLSQVGEMSQDHEMVRWSTLSDIRFLCLYHPCRPPMGR